MAGIKESLVALTQQLVDIPSVSRNEADVLAFITDQMKGTSLAWSGDAVSVFAKPRSGKPLVVVAGHTDTVPIANNVPSRIDGDVIYGRGTADMKAALAVMIEASKLDSVYDVAYLFFGREELPSSESALLPALEQCELLRLADYAILMEPTSNALELGCQGNLNLVVTFHGARAHSARPWTGSNAAHSAILALHSVASLEPNDVYIDDLLFREVANITAIRGGDARNVIPDRIEADINIRYAPNRTAADVERQWIDKFAAVGATVKVIGNSPGAPVTSDHPFTAALLAAGAEGRTPKQAWTNAADFALYDIPTVNFGPGNPALAHRDDESVTGTAIYDSYVTLSKFLTEEI